MGERLDSNSCGSINGSEKVSILDGWDRHLSFKSMFGD